MLSYCRPATRRPLITLSRGGIFSPDTFFQPLIKSRTHTHIAICFPANYYNNKKEGGGRGRKGEEEGEGGEEEIIYVVSSTVPHIINTW